MATYRIKPRSSNDDVRYRDGAGFQSASETFGRIGYFDGTPARKTQQVLYVHTIPAGSTITHAYLTLIVKAKPSGTGISFVSNVKNAALSITVNWTCDVSGMTVGGTITTPDIAAIVQDIVDTEGYDPEVGAGFWVGWGDAAKGEYFDCEVFDGAYGEDAWEIEVTYTPPEPVEVTGSIGAAAGISASTERRLDISGRVGAGAGVAGQAGRVWVAEARIGAAGAVEAILYPVSVWGRVGAGAGVAGQAGRVWVAEARIGAGAGVEGATVKESTAEGRIGVAGAAEVAAGFLHTAQGRIGVPMAFEGTAQHYVTLYPGGAWQEQWQFELDAEAVVLPAAWQRQYGDRISIGIGFALAALWQEQWAGPVDVVDPGVALPALWQEQWCGPVDDVLHLPALWQQQFGGDVDIVPKDADVVLPAAWQQQWGGEVDDYAVLPALWQQQWTGAPAPGAPPTMRVWFDVSRPEVVYTSGKPVLEAACSKPRVVFEVEEIDHG